MSSYVRVLLGNGLTSRGWHPVRTSYSGILEKNGLIFVYKQFEVSPNAEVNGILTGTMKSVIPSFSYIGNLTPIMGAKMYQGPFKGFSWHIEKDGYVITKGSDRDFIIINTIEELLKSGEKPNEQLLEYENNLYDYIDSFSELSDAELRAYKHREVKVYRKVKIKKFREINSGIRDTGMFVNITKSLDQMLPMDLVHQYSKDVSGDYLISLYNEDLSGFLYSNKPMDKNILEDELYGKGLIQIVELYTDEVEVDSTVWLGSVQGNSLKIPKELANININITLFNYVIKAFLEHVNYTCLLFSGNNLNSLDVYFELLSNVIDPRCLLNKSFDVNQLNYLNGLVKAGYNIEPIADPLYTAEYMQIRHEETLSGLYSLEQRLIEDGRTPEQARAIISVAYAGNGFGHVNRDINPLCVPFIDYCYRSDMVEFGELILPRVVVKEDFLLINYSSVPEMAKKLFWERFYLLTPEYFNGDKIDRIVSLLSKKARAFRFSKDSGLCLISGDFTITMNYNMVVIAESWVSLWSSLLINGKVITNSEKEDYIAGSL